MYALNNGRKILFDVLNGWDRRHFPSRANPSSKNDTALPMMFSMASHSKGTLLALWLAWAFHRVGPIALPTRVSNQLLSATLLSPLTVGFHECVDGPNVHQLQKDPQRWESWRHIHDKQDRAPATYDQQLEPLIASRSSFP